MFSLVSATTKKAVATSASSLPRTITPSMSLGATAAGSSLFDHQRCYRSGVDTAPNGSSFEEPQAKNFFPVYVHHVSKIVLEHLQESRGDWLISQGLDRGLYINPNGTFSMHFPSQKNNSKSSVPASATATGRIWTSYDTTTKQHWLSIYHSTLAVRFLLKDHGKCMSMTKVHDATKSERKIKAAVDQMISSVNQLENQNVSKNIDAPTPKSS